MPQLRDPNNQTSKILGDWRDACGMPTPVTMTERAIALGINPAVYRNAVYTAQLTTEHPRAKDALRTALERRREVEAGELPLENMHATARIVGVRYTTLRKAAAREGLRMVVPRPQAN